MEDNYKVSAANPVGSVGPKQHFWEVKEAYHAGIKFGVIATFTVLGLLALIFNPGHVFAVNFSSSGGCYDSVSDAVDAFTAQFPVVTSGVQYTLSSFTLSGSSLSYTVNQTVLSTGVTTFGVPAVVVFSDCNFHFAISTILEASLIFVLPFALGWLACFTI